MKTDEISVVADYENFPTYSALVDGLLDVADDLREKGEHPDDIDVALDQAVDGWQSPRLAENQDFRAAIDFVRADNLAA